MLSSLLRISVRLSQDSAWLVICCYCYVICFFYGTTVKVCGLFLYCMSLDGLWSCAVLLLSFNVVFFLLIFLRGKEVYFYWIRRFFSKQVILVNAALKFTIFVFIFRSKMFSTPKKLWALTWETIDRSEISITLQLHLQFSFHINTHIDLERHLLLCPRCGGHLILSIDTPTLTFS